MDLIAEFAARHPSDRIRWCALRARAAAEPKVDARIGMFEAAAGGGSRLVAEMARREVAKLERGRAWIERSPAAGPADGGLNTDAAGGGDPRRRIDGDSSRNMV